MKKRKPQDQVAAFNAAMPVGTPVLVKKDDGTLYATKTRSEAWCLGASSHDPGHTAVVMVDGISGGYLLERVTRREVGDPADVF